MSRVFGDAKKKNGYKNLAQLLTGLIPQDSDVFLAARLIKYTK